MLSWLVVTPGDDAVAGCPFAAADRDAAVGECSVALESRTRGIVELLARGVVASDHRDGHGAVGYPCFGPLVDHGAERVVFGGVDRDLVGLVVEVGLGVAVVERFERVALGGIVLAEHPA